MPDLAILAQTTVPPSAQDKLLPILNSGLRAYLASPGKNVQPEVLQYVAVGLHIHASRSLANLGTLPPTRSDLLPLEVLTKLLKRNTVSLDELLPTLTLDAIVAYPNHVSTIKQLLTEVLKDNVILGNALNQEVVLATIRLLERENSRIMKAPAGQAETDLQLPRLVYTLFLCARAHESLASTIRDARNFFDILRVTYDVTSGLQLDTVRKVQTKSHLLLLLHTLLEPLPISDKEWRLEMMDDGNQKGQDETLVDTGMIHDYQIIFAQPGDEKKKGLSEEEVTKRTVGEKQMDALRSLSSGLRLNSHGEDDTAMVKVVEDHRIAPILILFPDIPSELLQQALRHPRFAEHTGSGGAEDDAVTVLTNAMLDNTLPPELDELGRLVRSVTQADERERADHSRSGSNTGSRERSRQASPDRNGKKPYKRDNIFNDLPMDFSSLSFGKSGSNLDVLTSGIDEQTRASILRLSEQQRDEEEAAREAEREEAKARRARSAGQAGSSKTKQPKVRTVAFEEELEGEDLFDDETDARENLVKLNMREGEEGSSDGESYVNSEEDDDIGAGGAEDVYLEQLYLTSPKAFDRDATTRRSKIREQMRQQTGWSDEQLEGWRIMLERNPLKEKILSRHGDPRSNRPTQDRGPLQQGRGGGRGGGGSGSDRGRGGGNRGGGGRGRGGSKSSRGHQNAARTRGHDRKMARMGGA